MNLTWRGAVCPKIICLAVQLKLCSLPGLACRKLAGQDWHHRLPCRLRPGANRFPPLKLAALWPTFFADDWTERSFQGERSTLKWRQGRKVISLGRGRGRTGPIAGCATPRRSDREGNSASVPLSSTARLIRRATALPAMPATGTFIRPPPFLSCAKFLFRG